MGNTPAKNKNTAINHKLEAETFRLKAVLLYNVNGGGMIFDFKIVEIDIFLLILPIFNVLGSLKSPQEQIFDHLLQ